MIICKKLVLSATIVGSITGSAVAGSNGPKPNVLFIAVDDLNDWINCYKDGYPGGYVHTPNMDRLAKEGLLFDRAYCALSLCNPSRTALLTGRLPSSTGIFSNTAWFRDYDQLKDIITLPQNFKNNGYITVNAGKIFHHSFGKMCDPVSWDMISPYPIATPRPENENPMGLHFIAQYHEHEFRYGPLTQPKEQCGDFLQAKYCAEFLAKKHDKPFFLAYGVDRPHMPLFAPQKYFDLYPLDKIVLPKVIKNDYDDIPPKGAYYKSRDVHAVITKAGAWKYYVQAYLACISFADDCIGHVLDALDKSPYRDNTIIVLWGDNGYHLGEKEHWDKFTLWEPAARIPLIIKAPGVTTPGSETKSIVSLMDLYPTLVSLAGLPKPDGVEGRDLTPILKQPETEWNQPALTTWFPNNYALRSAQYRYIRYEDGTEELYDMGKDPDEFTNLANNPEYAATIQEMKKWLPATTHKDVEAP